MSNELSISWRDRLRILLSVASVARDPSNLDRVLSLSDEIASREEALDKIPAELRALGERLDDQLPLPPMAELRSLPTGTVGREYARFLDDHGLTPEALTPVEQEGPLGNLRAHMRGAHDLWHVVTGWTPDLLGELGLQAFYLAQLRVPFPGLILVAGLAHTVWKAPEHTFEVIDAVAEGWRQGQDAEMLAGLPWADYVEVPVSDLQAQLGITPARRRPEQIVPLVAVAA